MNTELNLDEQNKHLEIHYIFENNADIHSMDAFVRNKCELYFLNYINTINKELNLNNKILVQPKEEGSLVDVYTVVPIIIAGVDLLFSIITYFFPKKTKDELLIDKIALVQKAKELEEQGIPLPEKIKKRLLQFYPNHKLIKAKSNFFDNLLDDESVKSLEIVSVDKTEKAPQIIFSASRDKFSDYMLESDELDSDFDDNAEIEVISPVLKNGNYNWRGIYLKDKIIHEFKMKDKDFKKEVFEEGIPFQNGTILICDLEICNKLNEFGEEVQYQFIIHKVYDMKINESVTEMPSGKKRRKQKEMDDMQPSLFD